jgi:DNA-binding response OmpR family regulator
VAEQVLFVDDEPAILDGYRRLLYKDFLVTTAVGGEQGLDAIEKKGPFAVVISDMRMPQMNGVEFLLKVKEVSPDAIRLILTGQTELQAAIDAVNLGSVFRFLTKPCSKDVLSAAIHASLRQYQLTRVEKDLLEQTLGSSIQVMTEILSLISPTAFGRATRVRHVVRHVAEKLGRPESWQFEMAAMLSQLGCVTLHPDVVEAAYAGKELRPEEQARFDKHPLAAWELLSHIPRMEPVALMIAQQREPAPALAEKAGLQTPEDVERVEFGTRLLRLALSVDALVSRGASHEHALAMLASEDKKDEVILAAMEGFSEVGEGSFVRKSTVRSLARGMILEEDVKTHQGVLIVAKGQEITQPLVLKLNTFWQHGAIQESFLVRVPANEQIKLSA